MLVSFIKVQSFTSRVIKFRELYLETTTIMERLKFLKSVNDFNLFLNQILRA